MKIITVIPLARGMFKENLTYFTASPVALGEVVTVPLRNKKISALVVGSENLASSKSTIKRSAFSLKKADQIAGRTALPPGFIKAAYKLRSYAASSAPAVLAALLPKVYLENIDKLDERPEEPETEKRGIRPEKLILQCSAEERISYYKTYIRESFAKKKSVFIAVPTILDAEFFAASLSKGVENYAFVFHNDIPKKEFIKKCDKLAGESHPVLIIGTPPYLFLLGRKFEAVIVEEESRSAYKMPVRPYLDMRTWAEILSAEYGVKIIFGDEMLRLETLWRAKNYELTEIMPPSYRVGTGAKKELVDMKTDKKFAVLSEELKVKINEAGQAGKRTFLFASRKGVAGATVCGDCGERVSCRKCGKPLTLHGEEGRRFFMCHFCRDKSDALMTCRNCQSWNLKALGVGTDRVAHEVMKEFPKRPVFLLDRENAKSAKKAREVAAQFYRTPGAILVGTEMALYYMSEKAENAAIVSFDSLFGIPNFKTEERIMNLLIGIEKCAKESFIIQTRRPDEELIAHFMSGNLSEFVRTQLKDREDLNYPPFSTLIKISYRGPKANLDRAAAYLENLFHNYSPAVFKAFAPKIRNEYILNTVLKVKRKNWTLDEIALGGTLDPRLLEKLRSLPPALSVEVDPEDLL